MMFNPGILTSSSRCARFGSGALMVCCVLLAFGCKGTQSTNPLAQSVTDQSSTNPLVDDQDRQGLEIRLMVVDDSHWAPSLGLIPYLGSEETQSTQLDPKMIETWKNWGYRVVLVPIGEIDGYLDGLRPVQPTSVQWLGEFGQWRPIVRSAKFNSRTLRIGDQYREITGGRPTMIARSWIVPDLSLNRRDDSRMKAGLRLDLSIQIEDGKKPSSVYLGAVREKELEDKGPVLDELMYSMVHSGEYAIVIIGDSPERDWNDLPRFIESSVDGDDSEDQLIGPSESNGDSEDRDNENQLRSQSGVLGGSSISARDYRGPEEPVIKTLGELMLTSDGSRVVELNRARVIPKRVVIALIPRVQGEYWLLPRRGVRP